VAVENLSPLTKWLDGVTRQALPHIDTTAIFAVSLLLLVGLIFITRIWVRGAWPDIFSVVRGFLGMLLLFSGVPVAMALLFTHPPAIDQIPKETLYTASVLSLILTIAVGLRELRAAFFK
jgi:hypothetical protein